MKILIASVVSAVTTALIGVSLIELASIPNSGILIVFVYGVMAALGCVAAPATALHFFLRKKKKEPYLFYAIVAAVGVATFLLVRQYVMRYSSSGGMWPTLIVLTIAGFAGGLIYRGSLAFCDKQAKTV